jgi:hypothetical protein
MARVEGSTTSSSGSLLTMNNGMPSNAPMTDAEMVEILAGIARDETNAASDRLDAILALREIQGEQDRPTPRR